MMIKLAEIEIIQLNIFDSLPETVAAHDAGRANQLQIERRNE